MRKGVLSMEIRVDKVFVGKAKPDMSTVAFGTYFTDHMFLMDYDPENGWHDARIVPYGPLQIYPSSTIIQYASEVFEGLKAYRTPNGEVQLFRPDENAKRMNNSAERMALPTMPVEMQIEAMKALVEVDKDWVPSGDGQSLYLRPYMFANDLDIALHPYKKVVYGIIACPVGSYFPGGLKPAPLMLEMDDVRAVRGGTGFAKCGGNYAGAMHAGKNADDKGYSQVLWIDGVERKYVEEAGGMNVMFKIDGKIVTPQLNGSVLPGITRKSAIELLKSQGWEVEERLVPVTELLEGIKSGAVEEAWMIGTAAVVCPIGEFAYDGESYIVNNGEIGETTQKLYDDLTAIQWGKTEDTFGWTVKVD